MTPERWQQITGIFNSAVAITDAAARDAYLHEVCANDASLRAEIESLLSAHQDSTLTIDGAPFQDVRVRNRLAAGTALGRYVVEALLGAGGMGEVYQARDTRLNRAVALKILPPHMRDKPQLLARFEREAHAIAALKHPYICTLYDIGRHDDIDYLVMELVEGETLSKRLERERLSIAESVSLIREVAEALAVTHAQGIIHRDIKPSNIIITPSGHVKVVDFGLARESSLFRSSESTHDDQTEPGVRIGTAYYMSPEQALGEPLDARTDLFSVGVVLFECLTGERPFEGTSRSAYLQNVLSGQARSVASLRPDVPAGLQSLVAHCLERDAAKRLDSAGWLATELERLSKDKTGFRLAAWAPWIGAAAALIAVLGVVLFVSSRNPPVAPANLDVPQLRRFTTSPGEEVDSHFSPDGMWMSFIKRDRGERRLFVQRLVEDEPRPVTLPPGDPMSHVWSPDQTSYACLIYQKSGWTIQVMPTFFGGDVPLKTVLAPQIVRAAKLLRWIDQTIYLQVEESGRTTSLQQLNVVSGQFTTLKGPWSVMSPRSFDVRPDGARVVWSAQPDSARDGLWAADLSGAGMTELTSSSDLSRKRFPMWSSSGASVIYQSTVGGQVDLWELDVKTGATTRLTSDAGIERPESTAVNRSLSYQLTSQKTSLWFWDAQSRSSIQVSDDGLSHFAPTASRLGRPRVAFQRSQPSPVEGFLQMDTELFIADVLQPGGGLTAPKKLGTGFAPVLSSDGRFLAYLQRAEPGSQSARLLVRNVDTTLLETLSSTVGLPAGGNFPVDWLEQHFAWSSAEDLYFLERSPSSSRVVHYRVGSKPRALTATETTKRLTDIYASPNGETIAYLAWQPTQEPEQETYELHTFDLATQTDRIVRDLGPKYQLRLRGALRNDAAWVITRSVAFNPDVTWNLEVAIVMPNGTVRPAGIIEQVVNVSRFDPRDSTLYFTRSVDGVGNLFGYSLETKRIIRISNNTVIDATFGSAAALDPDRLVFVRHEQTKDINVLYATPQTNGRPGNR